MKTAEIAETETGSEVNLEEGSSCSESTSDLYDDSFVTSEDNYVQEEFREGDVVLSDSSFRSTTDYSLTDDSFISESEVDLEISERDGDGDGERYPGLSELLDELYGPSSDSADSFLTDSEVDLEVSSEESSIDTDDVYERSFVSSGDEYVQERDQPDVPTEYLSDSSARSTTDYSDTDESFVTEDDDCSTYWLMESRTLFVTRPEESV